jgi:periplasmic protein TonB
MKRTLRRGGLLSGAFVLAGCMATAPEAVRPVSPTVTDAPAAEIMIAAPPAPPEPPASPAPRRPPEAAASDGAVTPAVVLRRRAPAYPTELARQEISGRVVLVFVVGQSGRPENVRIESASHPLFAKAVLAVVPEWRFEPARDAGGQAVRTQMRMPLTFLLD